jgi:hypothetical protein
LHASSLRQHASNSLTPVIDHHQHLFSPAVGKVSPSLQPMNATQLAKLLDDSAAAFS